MKSIGIVVGDDADIPQELLKKLNIAVYPFVVEWDDKNISNNTLLYKKMREAEKEKALTFPRTSQPSVETFVSIFSQALYDHESILVFTISSAVSGCFNSAMQAKKSFSQKDQTRIYIIDSCATTGAEGLLALFTKRLINKGEDITSILAKLKQKKVVLYGTFDNPYWAQKGGRINSVQATVVKHMISKGFRPILTLKNGQITNYKIQIGAKDKEVALFKQFKEQVKKDVQVSIAITHSDCLEKAKTLESIFLKEYPRVTISYISVVSAVVGAHIGPDGLILSWIEE